jgi:[acyl-carrier-protein] S-malonyltransferase
MTRYAILFPGQGSQAVGMAPDVFAARPDLLGAAADDVLGWPLAGVVASGPEEELTRTDRAQPALYGVSYAIWEEFRSAVATPPVAAAGHSLGEYTALAAAGALDYWDGLRLVAARGAAMNRAASAEPSGMAALLGADLGVATAVCTTRVAEGGNLSIANINAPGQVVVAGGAADLAWLTENAENLGVRRAVPLKVAGAFHSPYMRPAAEELAEALATVTFAEPRFPVYANATAQPMADPVRQLAEQLVAPVRFAETLERMAADGVETFVHIGPGDVTAGLARRTIPDSAVVAVSSIEGVAAAARELSIQ